LHLEKTEKNKTMSYPSSQEYLIHCLFTIKYRIASEQPLNQQKGASSTDSNKVHLAGSMSLETAMVLPIVLMIFAAFLSLFSLVSLEVRLHTAMDKVCQKVSASYYVANALEEKYLTDQSLLEKMLVSSATNLLTTNGIRDLVIEEAGKNEINKELIVDGLQGLSFLGSGYQPLDDTVTVCVSYQIRVPYLKWIPFKKAIKQSVTRRAWLGKDISLSNEEQYVYVTNNGTVYHTSITCTYLTLSIREVRYQQLSNLRNANGSRYKACSICAKNAKSIAYITDYGECYHFNKNCIAIRRGILTIPISEVGDKALCYRCKERDGN